MHEILDFLYYSLVKADTVLHFTLSFLLPRLIFSFDE